MAGGWPSWKDSRVKAVLALSSYCGPFIASGNLRRLNVPVMYQGGTLDTSFTQADAAYNATSAPRYYVEFAGAAHLAWTDPIVKYQNIIAQYSIAFLDRYLKDTDHLSPLTANPLPPQVSQIRANQN
jgi:pimeloyl-ACP methyl ester carboxylesterase